MNLQKKRNELVRLNTQYVPYEESRFKINARFIQLNASEECDRELMVSYYNMLPLLEGQVRMEEADYILYCHPYACCHDMSHIVLEQLHYIDSIRKDTAEIIVVGKAANAEKLLNGSIKNISFYMSHFVQKLGERFGLDIKEKYFVYDDMYDNTLRIWPVDGCLQKCKFCRRTYMEIPFESLSLSTIKKQLDIIKEYYPEMLQCIDLRAENLTEYGIDLYGKPCLDKLIDLVDSYDEVKYIRSSIGLNLGEFTPEILNSICKSKKIVHINLDLEVGSNRLLSLIGRKHTREDSIRICNQIRNANPNIYISSMVMVGLPTEEITDMFDLANLLVECQIDCVKCNYYILAPKHPLAELPQLSTQLREYHLKIFLKALKDANLKRDLVVDHRKIYKNNHSRKAIKEKIEIENLNKRFYYFYPRNRVASSFFKKS